MALPQIFIKPEGQKQFDQNIYIYFFCYKEHDFMIIYHVQHLLQKAKHLLQKAKSCMFM